MTFTHCKPNSIKEIVLSLSLATTPLMFNPAWASDEQQTAMQVFSIPAQPLSEAIDAFIQATDWQVGFVTEQTQGLQSHAVEGCFSKEQALKKLLEGTNIQYRFIESNSITLQKRSAVALTSESLLAAAGEFVLAEAEPEEEPYTGPVEQEDLVVRGGEISPYIKTDSTAGSKISMAITRVPQSTQVITRDSFQDRGVQSISDIMKQVPSATITRLGFFTQSLLS